MVNGTGTVIFTGLDVLARRNSSAQFDRILALDLADDARHRDRLAAAVDGGAGVVGVNSFERRGETVGIAFAPLLAVGDNIEAGALLIADGDERRLVLLGFELVRIDLPEVMETDARHHGREPHTVDQPFRLRIGTDERGGEEFDRHGLSFGCHGGACPGYPVQDGTLLA